MLLVVAGLVVLVLVILVVVFLSVRSMRADEDDAYQNPPARVTAKPSRARKVAAGPSPAGAPATARAPAPARDAARDYEFAAPPRPRGHQHDQDGSGDRREPARRSRLAAARRDRASDMSDLGWDGASDEQYWAELSSDKPLASTARSAQPAPAAGPRSAQPGPEASGRPGPFRRPANGRGRSAVSDDPGTAVIPDRREPARSLPAGADAPDTDPGMRGPHDWPGLTTSAGQESWAAEQANGWDARDAAAWDAQPTTSWTGDAPTGPAQRWETQDPAAAWPGHDPLTSAWNTEEQTGAAWAGDQPVSASWPAEEPAPAAWAGGEAPTASPAWDDHDPLTSPAFSTQAAHAEDDRSYYGSHGRARDQASRSAGHADRTTQMYAAVGHDQDAGHGYPANPGWDNSRHDAYTGDYSQAQPPSQDWNQAGSGYGGLPDGYREASSGAAGGYTGTRRRGRHGADHPGWPGPDGPGGEGHDGPEPARSGWPEAAPGDWPGAGYGADDGYRADEDYHGGGYAERHSGGYGPRSDHADPAGYGQETGPGYSPGFGFR